MDSDQMPARVAVLLPLLLLLLQLLLRLLLHLLRPLPRLFPLLSYGCQAVCWLGRPTRGQR